jgi:RecA-family ATPase
MNDDLDRDFEDIDPRTVPPVGRGNERKQASPPEPSPEPHEPITPIAWAGLEGREPPAREFIVEDWLPVGVTTSLYGIGGVGKTLLAQILGTCAATGKPFLGLPTKKVPVLGVFCEDDDDELWRRQHRINRMVNLRMADLDGFTAQGRLGMANLLMVFPKGRPPEPLPLLAAIEAQAKEGGSRLIILDNVAQMFGGEENARAEVTVFLNALNGLARRLQAAVLLLGHPPKSGAEYSGSTAWHSVVRCMWTLTRITEKDDDGETVPDRIALTKHKANYAPEREEIRLHWVDGVLRRDDGEAPMSSVDANFHRHNARQAFLGALDELTAQRRNVSHAVRAGNYAPKAMKQAGLAEGFTKGDLGRAMNDLFAEKVITADAPLWRKANRHWVTGLARRGAPSSSVPPDAGAANTDAPPSHAGNGHAG